mgnify:CR=1 FL=1
MLTFKLNINRETFNKRFATTEKSIDFQPHKSYTNRCVQLTEKRI